MNDDLRKEFLEEPVARRMAPRLARGLVLIALASAAAGARATIPLSRLLEHGGEGSFHCALDGKTQPGLCNVSRRTGTLTDPDIVRTYAARPGARTARLPILRIVWPDGRISRYAFGDSREILRVGSDTPYGHHQKFSTWPNLDLSRGWIVLDEQEKEHIRLWP